MPFNFHVSGNVIARILFFLSSFLVRLSFSFSPLLVRGSVRYSVFPCLEFHERSPFVVKV